MGYDRDRYLKLREEFYRGLEGQKSPGSQARTSFDPADLDLLEQLRGRTTFHPLLYSVPALFGLYALTHFGNFEFFRNPLRSVSVHQTAVSRRVRQIYVFSFAVTAVPLIHGRFIYQYALAKSAVHRRYKHLVDQYVVLRDEMIFESLIKTETDL